MNNLVPEIAATARRNERLATEILMQRVLHCYAFGQHDRWQAICLDLDLAVQGGSFEEVFRLLNDTISFHMEGIMELPQADQQRLLSRRVSWLVRLKFALAGSFLASELKPMAYSSIVTRCHCPLPSE